MCVVGASVERHALLLISILSLTILHLLSCADADGDGYISRGEMQSYLSSVFRVLLEADPASAADMQARTGISAGDNVAIANKLAADATAACFAVADSNQDNKLSKDEFKQWYFDAMPADTFAFAGSNAGGLSSLEPFPCKALVLVCHDRAHESVIPVCC